MNALSLSVFSLLLALLGMPARGGEMGTHPSEPARYGAGPVSLEALVAEAMQANPEIRAARQEAEAAEQRIAPAGALNDPMLEVGVINLPVNSFNFRQDDMTMKMVGLAQRLPYPGKRKLREEVAEREADAIRHRYGETLNRVVRNVRVAYYNLALTATVTQITLRNRNTLDQLLGIARAKYEVGQGNQADVLKAQLQLSRVSEELIRLARERREITGELDAALGRHPGMSVITPAPLSIDAGAAPSTAIDPPTLAAQPQLLALQSRIARSQKTLDLATREYYPDFDLRFAYGQRDRAQDGMYRSDMIIFTVGINLPVWRSTKLAPMVAEAEAMRGQALDLYAAQRNELLMQLHHQRAIADQSLESARLYESTILPQARLVVDSSLAAYRVNRLDFLSVLDSQMTVFAYQIAYANAVAGYNKAIAEVALLSGQPIAASGAGDTAH